MSRGRAVDQTISRLAARTCSVVHADELRRAGVSRDAVRYRVEAGWMALVLPRTCARRPVPKQPFHFHLVSGIWLPRPADDLAIPVTHFIDMCRQLARTLTRYQLTFVIRRGLYHGFVELQALRDAVERCHGHRGNATMREAVALVESRSAGTRGPAEDALLVALERAGVPAPAVNVRGAMGMERDEPDLLWPRRQLNVEVDGRYHLHDESQLADDRARDTAAEGLGFRVARVAARDAFRRPACVVAWIARAVEGESVQTDPKTLRMVL